MQLCLKIIPMADLLILSYDRETKVTYEKLIEFTQRKGFAKILLADTAGFPGMWNYQAGSVYLSSFRLGEITHRNLFERLLTLDNSATWYPFVIYSEKNNHKFILNIIGYTGLSASSAPTMPTELSGLFMQHMVQYFKELSMYEIRIMLNGDFYNYDRESNNLVFMESVNKPLR